MVTFDPRLPKIQGINQKYWKGMTSKNPYLLEVFSEPPVVAFRGQTNIKDYLIRSKIPCITNRKSTRDKRGMKKCGKQCPSCPFIKEGKFVKVNQSKWIINTEATSETKNIVYLSECTKEQCKEKYIGETHRSLKEQTQEHISYVKSIFPTKSTGVHFNSPGHTLSNMTVTIREKSKR